MRIPEGLRWLGLLLLVVLLLAAPTLAEETGEDAAATDPEAGSGPEGRAGPPAIGEPALPEDQTLQEVLERAAQPPPEHYPDPVPDDQLWVYALFEQLEYRLQPDGRDQLGWEGQGWLGGDYDKLWWKSEGEAVFDGPDEGESETDLLYSRLVTPFWNLQAGAQYANGWASGDYSDRWSAVAALQGLLPGTVELDLSLYLSEEADFTAEVEGEYNLRFTQRLVLQPRAELGFAAQDVRGRGLGAGMTDANLDLRLRYELQREIAPYLGFRYRVLVGETADIAEDGGRDRDALFLFGGLRLAF